LANKKQPFPAAGALARYWRFAFLPTQRRFTMFFCVNLHPRKYSNGQFTAAVGRALTTDQDNIAELLMFSCKEHIACLHWTWEEKEKNLGSFDTNYIHNLSAYPPTNTIH
jgi:hypothetical protein